MDFVSLNLFILLQNSVIMDLCMWHELKFCWYEFKNEVEGNTRKYIKTIGIVRCDKYVYKVYNDNLNRIMFDIVQNNIVRLYLCDSSL